ncbi:MAG: Cytidylate kinase [Candidatus Dependentiae bacterium ADurb.Bin331]|nr:MAG: Cytidylate kinase [Candidatus Dependentiae bacterium ADurb.Bin331]
MIITIDGPTASGKSTIAKLMAQKLGWKSLSSGLLFRGLAYVLMNSFNYNENTIETPSPTDIKESLNPQRFLFELTENGGTIKFDGKDITPFLKDARIDKAASIIATDEFVRDQLVMAQRQLVKNQNVVVEGRDTGSTVFSDAPIKFFLTASAEIRAHRWLQDRERDNAQILPQMAQERINERDTRDMQRAISPLVVPEGALIIDSSTMNPEQTVQYMYELYESKMQKSK